MRCRTLKCRWCRRGFTTNRYRLAKFCCRDCYFEAKANGFVQYVYRGELYEPTPEQIREACERIQSEWTASEEFSRRVMKPEPIVIRPVRRITRTIPL